MRNLKYLILLSFITSCSSNLSDDVIKLSSNYSFYHESIEDNTIFNEKGDEIIPCNVIAYDFNDAFIVAIQNRTRQCDLDRKMSYPNDDSLFYWIVDHKKKLFLGPLTLLEYQQNRIKLNIPLDLQPKRTEYIKLNK